MSFWRAGTDGVTVMVKVRPRSRRPGVGGLRESGGGLRLMISVAEPAEGGKANRAVCTLMAHLLERPQSAVRIIAGETNSEKLLAVTGDSTVLADRLRAL